MTFPQYFNLTKKRNINVSGIQKVADMWTVIVSTLLIFNVVNGQSQQDQKLAEELFGSAQLNDPFANLEEVTSPKPTGLSALEKCGEGADEGVHVCVVYYNCENNVVTNMNTTNTGGNGLIDIRFGANACPHYMDTCCGLPQPQKPNPFEMATLVPPSSTTSTPPVVTSTTPRPSSVSCGIRNVNGIDFTITGNSNNEAEYGEFPWMVAILKTNYDPQKDQNFAICGGSLIAPNVVLTGAHCVADLQINQFLVRAGEWDTQTTKERLPYQERTVRQVIIHENYIPKVIYNDVALLILSSPFDRADNIGNICLPNQNESISSMNCYGTGWGKNVFGKKGKYQVILKKIELPTVEFNQCQKSLRTTRLGAAFNLHPSFMCAGGELGKDTCTGDGGSPLVCPDPETPGRYVQTGMVAWGIGCGEQGIPGVYVDVAKFRTWIDEKLTRLNVNIDSYNISI